MIELLEETKRAVRRPVKSATPQIQLIGDAVLLELLPDDVKTKGGLFIPETAHRNKTGYEGALAKHNFKARVVSVGPGKTYPNGQFVRTSCVPGDLVAFAYMAEYCDSYRWPSENHLIMPEKFVQMVYCE